MKSKTVLRPLLAVACGALGLLAGCVAASSLYARNLLGDEVAFGGGGIDLLGVLLEGGACGLAFGAITAVRIIGAREQRAAIPWCPPTSDVTEVPSRNAPTDA